MPDDDPDSPYRGKGTGLACPRCDGPLVADSARVMCRPRGCGEWWSKERLVLEVEWRVVETTEPYKLFGVKRPATGCPVCAKEMVTSLRAEIEFSHCDDHGIWLDDRDRTELKQLAGGWRELLSLRKRKG